MNCSIANREEQGVSVMLRRDEWSKVLSHRELEVATLVARGSSNKEVARELGVCEGTVKLHVRSIFRKVGASSRYGLIKLSASSSDAAQNQA